MKPINRRVRKEITKSATYLINLPHFAFPNENRDLACFEVN
jgi:hypothetical protein